MHYYLLSTFLLTINFSSKAQSSESIINRLNAINQAVMAKPCSNGAAVISNRAMNVFLADKTGYLAANTDLSFYTNYVTFNTSDAKFTINHNFQNPASNDEPIKKLFSFGVSANIANSFASTPFNKRPENEFGFTASYKWLGNVKTHLACNNLQYKTQQQQVMDAFRAAMLHLLYIEIRKKEADFLAAIDAIDTTAIPGQNTNLAKALLQQSFYQSLQEDYEEKFAKQQAALLTDKKSFNFITTGWTSLTTYIPLISPKYNAAQSLTVAFREKHPYPLKLMLSHNRLWESSKIGRLFVTLSVNCLFNNSILSYAINEINFIEYKDLGGTDTLHLAELKKDKVYLGNYNTFISPSISGRLVYFPSSSHVGISFLLEQHFGSYGLMNAKLGLPIVLINSKILPAVNFECYLMFMDMNNKINRVNKPQRNTIIGLSAGIPFSRLIY